jgi:hypothetical protein
MESRQIPICCLSITAEVRQTIDKTSQISALEQKNRVQNLGHIGPAIVHQADAGTGDGDAPGSVATDRRVAQAVEFKRSDQQRASRLQPLTCPELTHHNRAWWSDPAGVAPQHTWLDDPCCWCPRLQRCTARALHAHAPAQVRKMLSRCNKMVLEKKFPKSIDLNRPHSRRIDKSIA